MAQSAEIITAPSPDRTPHSEGNSASSDEAGTIETLEALLDVTYAWGYGDARESLRDLYNKAVRAQWISDDVLPWQTDVDLERLQTPETLLPLFGSDIYQRMSSRERTQLDIETFAWTLSQFLHGEQGALLAAAQIVSSAKSIDSKMIAASQVADEARHVEVYNRYLRTKVGFSYPINPHLKTLLDLVLCDSRWDMKFLGMQIMVEGLALAAFGIMRNNTPEPLLRELTAYVIGDEARHVAFGVLSLRDFYKDQPESVRREREDFVFEAARLMRDRFLFQEVWDKLGLPANECMNIALHSSAQAMFRQLLFAKIVPAVKKMGLLSDRQRTRFSELGILQFESWGDPFEQEAGPTGATSARM